MIEILPPIDAAVKLCGSPKNAPGDNYRLSRHCVQVQCADGTLLYHTLTGAVYHLPSGETLDAARDALIENWFLVPQTFDENAYADQLRHIAGLIKPKAKHKDHFTILTTTDCNARCRYCYEMGRQRIAMSPETAAAAAGYMLRESGGDRPLKLFWFGGEPLYNISAIDTITSILRRENVSFRSSMTSNGFYLTPNLVKKAVAEWAMEAVQITIDGTEETYNRIKAYIDDCPNPFARVMDNIDAALAAGVRVTIRLNMDRKNAEDISAVIDQICPRFKGKGNCNVYIALLRSYRAKINEFNTEQELLDCFFRLRDKIKNYGMLRTIPLSREITLNHCKADNDACEIILPDGRLEHCHHYVEGEQYGSIFTPQRDQARINAWKEVQKDYPACKTCPMYPLCINLKKCGGSSDGCSSTDRAIWLQSIQEQMLVQYESWKSSHRERTEEE